MPSEVSIVFYIDSIQIQIKIQEAVIEYNISLGYYNKTVNYLNDILKLVDTTINENIDNINLLNDSLLETIDILKKYFPGSTPPPMVSGYKTPVTQQPFTYMTTVPPYTFVPYIPSTIQPSTTNKIPITTPLVTTPIPTTTQITTTPLVTTPIPTTTQITTTPLVTTPIPTTTQITTTPGYTTTSLVTTPIPTTTTTFRPTTTTAKPITFIKFVLNIKANPYELIRIRDRPANLIESVIAKNLGVPVNNVVIPFAVLLPVTKYEVTIVKLSPDKVASIYNTLSTGTVGLIAEIQNAFKTMPKPVINNLPITVTNIV